MKSRSSWLGLMLLCSCAKSPDPSLHPAPQGSPQPPSPLLAKPQEAPHATPLPAVTLQPAPLPDAVPSVPPEAPRGQPGSTCRVLAIGDSLTDPKSHGGGYLELVRKSCPQCTIVNLGRGGDMTNQMRRRLLAYLETDPGPFSHWVVFGGVNDLYSDETAHRTLPKIEAELTHMYEAGRARGARVIAVTVTPWGGFRRYYSAKRGRDTADLNVWIREGVPTGRVDAVVDAFPLLSCGDPERLCDEYAHPHRDGLHFGPKGHERLGGELRSLMGPGVCPGFGAPGGTDEPGRG